MNRFSDKFEIENAKRGLMVLLVTLCLMPILLYPYGGGVWPFFSFVLMQMTIDLLYLANCSKFDGLIINHAKVGSSFSMFSD